MACWACGRAGRVHRWWCHAEPPEPVRTTGETKELARLVKAQAKDMRLRKRFEPPEHPAGQGRTMSFDRCLEAHMEPFMTFLYQVVENRL